MEIWRDVEGYESLYQISNKGQVKSFHKNKNGRILKPYTRKPGYQFVQLGDGTGKIKNMRVHRLVAIAFLEKVDGKDYVNHIDGNPSNNNVENLEWCTIAENNYHSMRIIMSKKSCHVKTKEIIEDYEKGEMTLTEIARKYNSCNSVVSNILKENGVKVKSSAEQKTKYKFDRKELLKELEKGTQIKDISKKFNIPSRIATNYKIAWKKGKYKIYE